MKACLRILKKYGHWIFLGLMILATLYMDGYIAQNILDGDASDYLNRGWIMAQQNNPFTRDFYFTTEVRLLDISAVFSLFFPLTDDWTLVRILGTVVMQAYYVISFLYLCRQADVSRPNAVFAAGLLLLPFSTPYARLVLYHLYYILYLANVFWIMGLTLRLLNILPGQRRKAVLPAVLLSGLWVFVGLNGIRHMMMIGIPMLAFTAVQLLLKLREYRWEDGRLTGSDAFWHTKPVRLLMVVLISCVFFAMGYVINTSKLLTYYDVRDMSSTFFIPDWEAEHYSRILNGWLIASGIRYTDMRLVGVRGLSLLASLFSFGYLMTTSLVSCFKTGLLERRLMHGMLGAAFVTATLVFVFESAARIYQMYYVPVVAMAVPALAQELGRLKQRGVSACRKLMILLVCGCFLFQGAYSLFFIRVDKSAMDQWGGMDFSIMNTVDRVRDCVDFMQENGYTHGYIDYWYANPMIEMSDGALNVGALLDNYEDTRQIALYRWGTSKTAFSQENLPEKVMVFIERQASKGFETTFPDAPLVHEGWIFNGYEVDSSLIE